MTKSAVNRLCLLIIRIFLVIFGLYMIRIYIPPFVSLRVLNLGNIFGIAAGGGIALFGVLLSRIIDFLKTKAAAGYKKQIKIALSVISALIIAFLTAFFATLGSVVHYSDQTAANQQTVIVLGCQVRGSTPSMSLYQRCEAATEYLKEHPDAVAIASGGKGSDESLSEAQCIYNILTENGIEPDRIIIEDKSTSTNQNIKNSKKIIEKNNLSKEVAVVTNDYHEKRAQIICKKNGLNSYSVPAPSSKWGKPTFYTREVFAIWVQLL